MNQPNQVKARKFLTPEQKFKIVKEQMTTKACVADICKEYDVIPSAFYCYQEQFFAGALEAFKSPKDSATKAELRQIEVLEKDNSRMKKVISEIIFLNVDLKKKMWGIRPDRIVPYSARFELKEDLPKQIVRTGFSIDYFLDLFGVHRSTYYGWFSACGELLPPVVRKNANPRKALYSEIKAIVEYRKSYMDVRYRKLTC